LGDKKQLSRALTALAFLRYAEGNPEEAGVLCEESLALSRERRDRGSIAIDVLNLAWVLITRGLGDRCREMLSEGFSIADEFGSKSTGVTLLGVASHLAAYFGDWTLAAKFAGAVWGLSEQEGLHSEPA